MHSGKPDARTMLGWLGWRLFLSVNCESNANILPLADREWSSRWPLPFVTFVQTLSIGVVNLTSWWGNIIPSPVWRSGGAPSLSRMVSV